MNNKCELNILICTTFFMLRPNHLRNSFRFNIWDVRFFIHRTFVTTAAAATNMLAAAATAVTTTDAAATNLLAAAAATATTTVADTVPLQLQGYLRFQNRIWLDISMAAG